MTDDRFEIRRFDTAREFIDALDVSRPGWSAPDEDSARESSSRWIFRGQADSRWRLQPSAWRADPWSEGGPLGRLRAQLESFDPPPTPELIQHRYHQIWIGVQSEIAAVCAFASLADDLGIPVPDHHLLPGRFDPFDQHWRSELVALARPHVTSEGRRANPRPFAANSAFALAQHHGIPTRLLDCTRDSAVAAYFAAESAPRDGGGFLSVWAVDAVRARQEGELAVVQVPRSHITFLHAQSGVFLLHARAESWFEADGEWPDLLSSLERLGDGVVRRFDLPHAEAPELSRILWRRRVSLAHMMPTYDSVTATLRRQWELFGG